ncbi:MAG: pyridoxamine 5'-phosphate oxidase family protein [Acidimicrobiales bacterium]
MRLDPHEAMARLASHDHAVLCTVHSSRGVDAVPVAYALDPDGYLGVPVDLVKPKSSLRLQRERNLESDPRAALLAEHWDGSDWSQLWWARAELLWQPEPDHDRIAGLSARLETRYPQYVDRPFARLIILRIVEATGWSARGV